MIRIDYHGSKEVPTGTCHAILKAAGLKERGLPVPGKNPNPKIIIQNQQQLISA